MAVSHKKLKIDECHLTGAQVVAYLADPQSAGDYYAEDGMAPMNWLATPFVNEAFGLGPISGKQIRHVGRPDRGWRA